MTTEPIKSPPLDAAALIPHRPPMLMIDLLESLTNEGATASVMFDDTHMAVSHGQVLEAALVECIAQTAAAMEGMRHRTDTPAADRETPGMLCSVTRFAVYRRPDAGEHLDITVQVQKRLGSMLLIDGRVSAAGEPVASGSLTLKE